MLRSLGCPLAAVKLEGQTGQSVWPELSLRQRVLVGFTPDPDLLDLGNSRQPILLAARFLVSVAVR